MVKRWSSKPFLRVRFLLPLLINKSKYIYIKFKNKNKETKIKKQKVLFLKKILINIGEKNKNLLFFKKKVINLVKLKDIKQVF